MPQAAPGASVTYEPEVFPYRWLPADRDIPDLERDRALVPVAPDQREIGSTADLEAWLNDLGELNGAVSQEGSRALRCDDLPD